MIKLEHIYKNYTTSRAHVLALSDINLEVKRGEIFGIIGKSGAGKSTLIRCVNLLETPSSGHIFVAGEDLTTLTPPMLRAARKKIGMIFQHFNLLSSRTVFDNVALPLELSRQKNIEKTVLPLLDLTGLAGKKDRYPAELSGGQKQRVAIARALASNPHVLLSDEATSSLDPETTFSILQLLKNIRDSLNLTILLITHEMSVIKNCCDRVGILQEGQLIEQNEVGEFFASPKTDTAKNFIASSILQHLPDTIASHLQPSESPNAHPILRIWFFEGTATQPIISDLSLRFDLRVNILQGNVEYIKKHAMGIMVVACRGDQSKIHDAIEFLKQMRIKVEILGYVPNNIITFI